MPRKINPALLGTGHGKAAPDEASVRPSLTGTGLVGPGPNIGQAVAPQGSIGLGSEALSSHLLTTRGAHTSQAIEHAHHPGVLFSSNVSGALNELIGTVVKRPPFLGQWSSSTNFSGIPDWGHLKLRDGSLDHYGGLVGLPDLTLPSDIFPYYFSAPGPAQDTEFVDHGNDPQTDWLWNTGLAGVGQPGMGWGRSHLGGFTRDGDVGPDPMPVMRTARLYPRTNVVDGDTSLPTREAVTVSGSIFPADRGVLALLHFPVIDGGDMQALFLAQPLVTDETTVGSPTGRVVAALLLGGGLYGESVGSACAGSTCDGGAGGIFAPGLNADTNQYDPFTFPGRATGQYDLKEIHTGLDSFANPLREPWDDTNGDSVAGSARGILDTVPAPGQVRLGTDPNAGVDPIEYGIPILGGTIDYFDVAPTPQNGSLGIPIKGDTLLRDSNYFRFRLPVLKDYSQATGLKWTPRGDAGIATQETRRFFEWAAPVANLYPDGDTVEPTLKSAGFYENGFDEDYWVWQIARYRHSFLLPSSAVTGSREEIGSYWLVHFKTEADFEKCVRDGVFPWDLTEGYEVYGYSLAGSPPTDIEDTNNVVNDWPNATPPRAPDGPAPNFGFAAKPYHGLRATILMDPDGLTLPTVDTAEYDWATTSVPGTEAVMWVSGAVYHTPRLSVTGGAGFSITDLDLVLDPGFWTSYRTNQTDLTSGVAPAILASPNPLFVNVAPWAYAGSGGLPISATVPVGSPGVGFIPDTSFEGRHRIEVPFQYLGSNGSGGFSDSNGPLDTDDLTLTLPSSIVLLGDVGTPAFGRDVQMRAYFRRPLTHTSDNTAILPYSSTNGHGVVLSPADGNRVLFHSTRFSKNNPSNGLFGNYVVSAVGSPPNTSYSNLYAADKTAAEIFLDETFRVIPAFSANIAGHGHYTTNALNSLIGPGMSGWVGGPVEIPVKIGLATTPWNEVSWLLMECHLEDLTAVNPLTETGLQVSGLPDRNPPQSAAVQVPFPSSGMLLYPFEDLSSVSPEGGVHFTGSQPDYSSATGVREYVRVLDAGFAHFGSAIVSAAGTTEVVLRVDGLLLEDFAYTAPGPGGLVDDRISLSLKVPGLTTWMDIGRQDGAGPSKQDVFQDGAGCQVQGDETYNFMDPDTGYVGCYIKVHVGPSATLFANSATLSGYTSGSPLGEVPVLVQVKMGVGVVDKYDLEHRVVSGTFEGTVTPGAAPNTVRGLLGLSVVHPNVTLIPSLEEAGVTLL